MRKSEYATAVDPTKIGPFKAAAIATAKKTARFPESRHVKVATELLHAHGGVYEYVGREPHKWCQTTEGLGNKNWIAEWMYANAGDNNPRYRNPAVCTVMMAVNDNIAQGALPVAYTDEVAAGDSDWFTDEARANDFFRGIYHACEMSGMALVAGESPSLSYLIKAAEPVKSAPSLSGTVVGIIAPATRLIDGSKLGPGSRIIGVTSSGLHANGVSLVIKRGMSLKDKFLARLPNGNTLGDEALKPTRCYVDLVETLLKHEVEIHALLPGTGGGVAKLAFDKRPLTYVIHSWPEVPVIFRFMRELGVTIEDCLTTFNWGVGYYVFVPESEVKRTIALAGNMGYDAMEIGYVEEGKRCTVFQPINGGLELSPPHE